METLSLKISCAFQNYQHSTASSLAVFITSSLWHNDNDYHFRISFTYYIDLPDCCSSVSVDEESEVVLISLELANIR